MDIKIQVGISWLWFFPGVSISRYIFHEGKFAQFGDYFRNWGQHLEDAKKGNFSLQKQKKKVKRGTPNLTSPYGASLYFFLRKKKMLKKVSHHQEQHPEVGLS